MDDSGIIRLFYERSEDAVAELSRKYGKVFIKVAMNVLHDREDAEECVNDAYLAVWNNIPPENPSPLVTYVCRIVKNQALNRYRHNMKGRKNNEPDICIEELEEIIPSAENAESKAECEAVSRCISDFLRSIDRKNAMIFVRRFWYLDGYDSIANAVGLSESAVRMRASRIKADLKKYLEERGINV